MKRTMAILTAICLLAGGVLANECGIGNIAARAEELATASPAAEEAATAQAAGEQTPAPDGGSEQADATDEPPATDGPLETAEPAETTDAPLEGAQPLAEEPEDEEADGPAWYMDGETKRFGALENLVLETSETIYIRTGEVFALTGDAAAAASTARLRPDPEAFNGDYAVRLSGENPDGESAEATLYIWVALDGDDPPVEPPEIEAELYVEPSGYSAGTWTNAAPSFALSAIPGTLTGYTFAVSIDGGELEAIAGATYSPSLEGAREYLFLLIDSDGIAVDRSAVYTVALDLTAPEVQAALGRTGALSVTASDALSGIGGISFDGGETWFDMEAQEDGGYAYQHALSGSTLAAGMLVVRDAAGNLWTSDQSYAAQSGGTGGMGGGGMGSSGSSGSTRTVSHSSGSSSSATAYDAVALDIEDEAMTALTIGGEALDLALYLDSAGDGALADEASFRAEFAAWNGEADDENWDTLVLTATDADIASPYAYRWEFSGAVYKKLANSGIQYLVLKVGDRITAISTAGFTAGERYNLLKAEGVASKAFRYSVWMGVPDPEMEMEVSVEGENHLLAGDRSGEMYYYDVYTGSPEMMEAAFGAYARQE